MATEFNADFIERRMAEHKRWQHDATHALLHEAIEEIQALPQRKPTSGTLFDVVSRTGLDPRGSLALKF